VQFTGTTLVAFTAGVATFSVMAGPMINSAGTYTLTATESDYTLGVLGPTYTTPPITSNPFQVGGYHLNFRKQPANTDVDTPLLMSVYVEDSRGLSVGTVSSGSVQLSLESVSGSTASLSAYTNSGFDQGAELFTETSSPSIDTPGKYTLTATALDSSGAVDPSILPATSKEFQVTGLRIVFREQPPKESSSSTPIPFSVAIEDAKGAIDKTQNPILQAVSAPSGLRYSISSAVHFQNGVATFPSEVPSGIIPEGTVYPEEIQQEGKGYVITVSAVNADGSAIDEIAAGTSKPFDVVGYHLAFLKPPENGTVNQAFPFTLAVETGNGKIETGIPPTTVRLTISPDAETTPQLINAYTTDDGEIDFPTGYGGLHIDAVGQFTLTATAYDIDGMVSDIITAGTSKGFRVLPSHLSFVKQPESISEGFPIPYFQVDLENSDGMPIVPDPDDALQTGYDIQISYEAVVNGKAGPPTVLGDQTSVAGVASFTLYHIDQPGTYVIVAEDIDGFEFPPLPATSHIFKIL